MALQRDSVLVQIHEAQNLREWREERAKDPRDWTNIYTFVDTDDDASLPELPVIMGDGSLEWAIIVDLQTIMLTLNRTTFTHTVHHRDLAKSLMGGTPYIMPGNDGNRESDLVLLLNGDIDELREQVNSFRSSRELFDRLCQELGRGRWEPGEEVDIDGIVEELIDIGNNIVEMLTLAIDRRVS